VTAAAESSVVLSTKVARMGPTIEGPHFLGPPAERSAHQRHITADKFIWINALGFYKITLIT
jgi:hypothetical protein